MKILLISSNPTIEKLFTLSAEKKGDNVIVGSKDFLLEEEFDVVFVDIDDYDESFMSKLKEKLPSAKFVLILSKKDEKLPGFDAYLTKPFLPTDLIDFIEKLPEMGEGNDDFDIENFDDELNLEEENFDLGELEKEDVDEFALDDLDDLDMEIESDNKDDFADIEELEELNDDEVLVTEDELLNEAPDSDIEDTIAVSEDELLDDKLEPIEETENNDEATELDEELGDLEDNNDLDETEELDVEVGDDELLESEKDENEIDDELNLDENSTENSENLDEINENADDSVEEVNENDEEMESTKESSDMDDLDLENINEAELAKVLGEEINDVEENKEENENVSEANKTDEEINEESPNIEQNIKGEGLQEKTLGSILNINWEELKKAKAKVTITIDFGD
jgi:hypothetical protein